MPKHIIGTTANGYPIRTPTTKLMKGYRMTDKPCCCNETPAPRICPAHLPMDRYAIGHPILYKGEPAIGYLYGFSPDDGEPQFGAWYKIKPIIYDTWQEAGKVCEKVGLGTVIVVTTAMLKEREQAW